MRPSEWPWWAMILAVVLYGAAMVGVVLGLKWFREMLPFDVAVHLGYALFVLFIGLWIGYLTGYKAAQSRNALGVPPAGEQSPDQRGRLLRDVTPPQSRIERRL